MSEKKAGRKPSIGRGDSRWIPASLLPLVDFLIAVEGVLNPYPTARSKKRKDYSVEELEDLLNWVSAFWLYESETIDRLLHWKSLKVEGEAKDYSLSRITPPIINNDNNPTMSKIITVFNQSGGVGKSTLTMNLGYHLAQHEHRVLLIDMDPQASLTAFMGLEPFELKKTIYESVMASEPLPIHTNIYGVDLAPANINLSGAELELVVADMRDYRLKEALSEAVNQYDYILIDCPPSLGILSYISLVAATHVLIPIQTHYKSLKGTELLLRTIARVKARPNKNLKIAGVIPTMHEARTVQGGMALQSIQASRIGTIFPAVPRSVSFADASQEHLPLALHNPKHPAVALFNEIAGSLEALV